MEYPGTGVFSYPRIVAVLFTKRSVILNTKHHTFACARIRARDALEDNTPSYERAIELILGITRECTRIMF